MNQRKRILAATAALVVCILGSAPISIAGAAGQPNPDASFSLPAAKLNKSPNLESERQNPFIWFVLYSHQRGEARFVSITKDKPEVLDLATQAGTWYVYQAVFDTSNLIRERIQRYHDHGIGVEGTIVLGLDDHTEDFITGFQICSGSIYKKRPPPPSSPIDQYHLIICLKGF